MADLEDFDLDEPEQPPEVDEFETPIELEERKSFSPLLPLVTLVLGVPLALYLIFRSGGEEPEPSPDPPRATLRSAPTPLETPEPTPTPIDLPPLNESDGAVRGLIAALSAHPEFAAWFVPEDLLRRFVVVVENIADGEDPSVHLKHLAPQALFAASGSGDEIFIDARSFARFDEVGEIAMSIDAAEAVRIYHGAQARISEAYKELGHPTGAGFDRTLRRAIDKLIMTPLKQGRVDLVRYSVAYEFADRRLEGLEPAQKALVRMGAENQRRIQNKLREIIRVLDAPATDAEPEPEETPALD